MSRANQSERTPRIRAASVMAGVSVVAVLLAAAAFFGNSGLDETEEAGRTGDESAEKCVERMLDAAASGDVEAYLDCFTGKLRERIERGFRSGSREQLAAELRSREADLKNFVTEKPKNGQEPPAGETKLLLVRSYSDHNERHRVRFSRVGDSWKIAELVPLESLAPRIEYGTPVVPIDDDDAKPAEQAAKGADTDEPGGDRAPAD